VQSYSKKAILPQFAMISGPGIGYSIRFAGHARADTQATIQYNTIQ